MKLIELSHTIEDGLVTYRGLPALLGAGIPAPPKVRGLGSFPVRAVATVEG